MLKHRFLHLSERCTWYRPAMRWDFLSSREGDDDSVSWALRTARSLHQSGDDRRALDWLRRAARNAAEAGLDARAGELYVAAGRFQARTVPGDVSSDWSESEHTAVTQPPFGKTQKSPTLDDNTHTDSTLSDATGLRYRQRSDTLITSTPSETMDTGSAERVIQTPIKGLTSTLPAAGGNAGVGQPRTYRVAFLAAADSGCAVALRLRRDDHAPEGSASAVVIPNSLEDAAVLESLWK